ncbi:Uncharacterized protein TCM_026785 [Theobroma cacao]|uniref:Uncharacterized protein n=1 Tax=Theobroma cacao TaxID=3641 RepID=A0A061FB56_THECC|nr:Uncharacterized protein TCM_026785 [Theobroma cacao]
MRRTPSHVLTYLISPPRRIPTTSAGYCRKSCGFLLKFSFQTVQPQKRKKKQSMETKATDSNAVIRPQTTSSTTEKLKLLSSGHPKNHHLGTNIEEETNCGHRRIDDRNDTSSEATRRNADVAHLPAIFISVSVSFFSMYWTEL